jgi:hypothetical protein
MLTTESGQSTLTLLDLPYMELSFGVMGQTLPADHGYRPCSAIASVFPCGTLIAPLMPQGVEHYCARSPSSRTIRSVLCGKVHHTLTRLDL